MKNEVMVKPESPDPNLPKFSKSRISCALRVSASGVLARTVDLTVSLRS
jgi:hypothetical protein